MRVLESYSTVGLSVCLVLAVVVTPLALVAKDVKLQRTVYPTRNRDVLNPDFHYFHVENDDYAVSVEGQKAFVRASRESRYPFNRPWPQHQRSIDQSELASYIAFEGAGPVAVEACPTRRFSNVVIRPLSADVSYVETNGVIRFTLPGPGYYVLELDGPERALQLFYDEPEAYSERKHATRIFGPGFHMAWKVDLKEHDRIYIDRDAIVFGCFMGVDVHDVKIFGHGVIDGRCIERVFEGSYSDLQPSCVRFVRSGNVTVDGPILMDSPNWACAFFDCEDVSVRHVKICGQWRYNTDGIDLSNCRRVRVSDSYVRSFDDTFVIKGIPPYSDRSVEDIVAERLVLWCGWGQTLEPGIETWAPSFRRIRICDCDLIHSSNAAVNISCGGNATIEDVVYENLRVELQKGCRPQVIQTSDEMRYDVEKRCAKMPDLLVFHNYPYEFPGMVRTPGFIRNVIVRNLQVYTEPGCGKPRIVVKSATRPFEDIVFEGFKLNDAPVDSMGFEVIGNTPIDWR